MFKKIRKTLVRAGINSAKTTKNYQNVEVGLDRPTGITLIALIITIVILIILAGVTISMTLRRKRNIPKIKTSSRRIPNSRKARSR